MLIQIILISNDQNYSYAVLTDLSGLGRKFTVTELAWDENLSYDFEFALASGKYTLPTIVMLDFGFGKHDYERVAKRVEVIREVMAIECMVLRPPEDAEMFADMRARGLPMFEGVSTPAIAAEMIH